MVSFRTCRYCILAVLIINSFFIYFISVDWFSGKKVSTNGYLQLMNDIFSRLFTAHIDNVVPYLKARNLSAQACQDPTFLTIVINSGPGNYVRRDAIRRTWGNFTSVETRNKTLYSWRVIFVVGKSENNKTDYLVEVEAKQFGDLIVLDLIDNYKNLTEKTLAGMYWMRALCSKSQFYLKGDDDVFFNTYRLLEYLKAVKGAAVYKDIMIGRVAKNNRIPCRARKGKYFVSYEDYPHERFPPYCSGFAYVMPISSLHALLGYVKYVKKIPMLDDVYIGVLARAAGVEIVANNKRFHFYHPELPKAHRFSVAEVNVRLAEHGIGTFKKQNELQNLARTGIRLYH